MTGMAHAGRIGPNAVIRLAEALDAVEGPAAARTLFRSARLETYLETPPKGMVPEEEVTALHRQLRQDFAPARAASVSWLAGLRTADYLLARRIPKPVQRTLRLLPRRLAAFILLKAIGAHAWTFAGSARFSWRMGRPVTISLADCPLCRLDHASRPCCGYYAATFEALFRELVAAPARVSETSCCAMGAPACRFEIHF